MIERVRAHWIAALFGMVALSCGGQAATQGSLAVEEGVTASPWAARDRSLENTTESPPDAPRGPVAKVADRPTMPGVDLIASSPTREAIPIQASASVGAAQGDALLSPAPAANVGDQVGDLATSFELPSASGQTHAMDSYLGERNIVLVFYRAFW